MANFALWSKACAKKTGPDVLELRIHGIRNTAPHVLLGCNADSTERVGGSDALSGFWKQATPDSSGPTRVEAYSWGNVARTSPSSSILKGTGRVIGQTFWFLLVPFALTNAAYWARKLPTSQSDAGSRNKTLSAGVGAGTVRLFALLLSLVFTTTFCTVALSLLAVECFPSKPDQATAEAMCKQLPEGLNFLTQWSRSQRLALFSMVPILAILTVFLTAWLARVTHLAPQRVAWNEDFDPHKAQEGPYPFLASPGLWTRPHISNATGKLHIAACFSLTGTLLVSDNLWRLWPETCRTSMSKILRSDECLPQLGPAIQSEPTALLLTVANVLVLLASTWGVVRISSETRAPQDSKIIKWGSNVILFSGISFLLLTVLLLALDLIKPKIDSEGRFEGTSFTSLFLLTALTVLAVSGLFMRRGRFFHLATLCAGALSLAVVLWAFGVFDDWVFLVVVSIGGFVLLLFYFRSKVKIEGWDGRGPGIFMFAAILVTYFLSSALVLGTKSLLERPMTKELPAEPKELWRGRNGALADFSGSDAPALEIPPAYAATGGLLIVAICIAILGLVPACIWLITNKGLKPMQEPDLGQAGPQRQILTIRRRRLSAMSQRGEAVLGLLSLLIWVVVVLVVTVSAYQNGEEPLNSEESGASGLRAALEPYADFTKNTTESGIVVAAILVLIIVVKNAATSAEDRPLAILWDIMCFLPNAAHPFGAPSYSNRVVPEFAQRIQKQLDEPATGSRSSKVLISAHSLGAVLAIAALFHLKACQPDTDFRRIRLLTYGVQLRAYFGRFFPELFGPNVLGTAPTRGPSLFSADPWKKAKEKEMDDGKDIETSPSRLTLMKLLQGGDATPATPGITTPTTPGIPWRNLWRRTDYLGFPANKYTEDNGVDVYAIETDPGFSQFRLATHGNYTATTTYAKAREDLLSNWP